MTDTERVVEFVRHHPGSTVMEIRMALWVSNVTARMSDARKEGIVWDKTESRVNGRRVVRFSVRTPTLVTSGTQEALAL